MVSVEEHGRFTCASLHAVQCVIVLDSLTLFVRATRLPHLGLTLRADHIGDNDAQVFHFLHAVRQLRLILLLHLLELILHLAILGLAQVQGLLFTRVLLLSDFCL